MTLIQLNLSITYSALLLYIPNRIILGHMKHLIEKPLRCINYIIDYTIILIISSFMSFSMPIEFFDVIYYGCFFLYYFLFELVSGQTPAKLINKVRVVGYNGLKPNVRQIFVRTLCRLIHLDLISFLIGSSGMHDTYSKTIVVNVDPPDTNQSKLLHSLISNDRSLPVH